MTTVAAKTVPGVFCAILWPTQCDTARVNCCVGTFLSNAQSHFESRDPGDQTPSRARSGNKGIADCATVWFHWLFGGNWSTMSWTKHNPVTFEEHDNKYGVSTLQEFSLRLGHKFLGRALRSRSHVHWYCGVTKQHVDTTGRPSLSSCGLDARTAHLFLDLQTRRENNKYKLFRCRKETFILHQKESQ